MMRILHIIPDLPVGGAEMVVMTYLRNIHLRQDIEIRLVSLSSNQNRLYENIMASEGMPVDYLNQNIFDNSIRGRLSQICQLRNYIKAYAPDVIHFHLSIVWIVGLAIIGLSIKSIFHTLHSDPSKTSYGKNLIIDRFFYRLFNIKTICLNDQMKIIADRIFHRNDTLVLANGIDLAKYRTNLRNHYRAEFGICDDVFVLGHVGRFTKVKNHVKIIEVFAEIRKLKENAKLILVGEGNDEVLIRTLCKDFSITDDVIFTGTRSDVPGLMQMFDYFIFPSLYEGLGIVLIEAQAVGLPCIISEAIPSEAVVTDNVIRMNNSDEASLWANAIVNASKKTEIPQNYIEVYDTKNVISKLIGFYHTY